MLSGIGKRKLLIVPGILLLLAVLYHPVSNLTYGTRLALILLRYASGTAVSNKEVREIKICRQAGGSSYEALVYYPAKRQAHAAVVITPGLSELGCYHPGLISLARLMAQMGILVITPDIRIFREFQISAEPIEEIIFWYQQVPDLAGSTQIKKTGLAGISFSGTLALLAAARPEIRYQIAFAIAIGPYYDLSRCAQEWFAPGPVTVGEGHYPTRYYARWIIMAAALAMLPAAQDRLYLDSLLKALLVQKPMPQALPDSSEEANRWYRLATMREDRSDLELAEKIQNYLFSRLYSELDPRPALADLHCPLFLLHGAYDDLIPPRESLELHQRIKNSYLLISPFLTHTHPSERPLSLRQKVRSICETVAFCYQLARAIR